MFGIPMIMSQKLQEEQKRPDNSNIFHFLRRKFFFWLLVWELLMLKQYAKLLM